MFLIFLTRIARLFSHMLKRLLLISFFIIESGNIHLISIFAISQGFVEVALGCDERVCRVLSGGDVPCGFDEEIKNLKYI